MRSPSKDSSVADTAANSTRARILEAGIACFARYGNDRTTLQDVAVMAGVARNTVYRYFADRSELGRAVQEHEQQRMAAEFAEQAIDPRELRRAIEVLVRILHDTAERYRLREHLADLDVGQLRAWHTRREADAKFLRDALTPYVERAYKDGALVKGVRPNDALDWIVVAVSTLAFVPIDSVDPKDAVAVGQFYASNITRGIARE